MCVDAHLRVGAGDLIFFLSDFPRSLAKTQRGLRVGAGLRGGAGFAIEEEMVEGERLERFCKSGVFSVTKEWENVRPLLNRKSAYL